ncbi:hypothetical protein [Caulobacter sp. LARHSG274]
MTDFDGVDLGPGFNRIDADGRPYIALTLAYPALGPRAVAARRIADPDPFSPPGYVLV